LVKVLRPIPIVPAVDATVTPQRWLRVQKAADLLGVSPSTVRRWADSGRIDCRRTPSGQRRFLVRDLERAVDARDPDECGGQLAAGRHSGRRYQLLYETGLELASSLEPSEVLQSAARRLTSALRIPDCDIYRLDGGERLVCLASVLDGVHDSSWVSRELSLLDMSRHRRALESRSPVTVTSLDDPWLTAAEHADMHTYGQRSCLALPLEARGRLLGVVDLLDRVERDFSDDEVATAEAVGQLVALALERAELYEQVRRLHLGNLRALSSALSAKDYYTLGHASRVAAYAAMLGQELGWPDERLEALENAAFLHDIGKIGVSDRVLLKAGPLTSEEWDLVRQHPGISAEIVRPLFDEELVAGVRHHHERFDGRGYPDGLAGEEIPVVARAMCVVDCYDAMSCQRPYRPALSYGECLAELRRCSGTQFDPAMVVAFCRTLERLEQQRASVLALATEAAQLIDPAAHALLRARADQDRPEYRRMVSALRRLRDANPPVRFITSFALDAGECVTVLDTGETEDDVSRCGDPWLPEDELSRVLAGESLLANVLNADDYGVWVSGIAPVRDETGAVVAAVTVDAPAAKSAGHPAVGDRSQTLAAMLRAAAIRFSRAEVEAITDGLTGLYNHRYLHERLEEELERSQHGRREVSVLFCDCDRFKAFNDEHGHKAGDAALAQIARTIEANSRRTDLAARYGGEEFVLALIDTDAAGAQAVAETIRAEVEAVSARHGRPLTISIGIATSPGDACARDELLDKADWAMYAAKRAGRNRVLAFSDGLVRAETWLSRRGR
jgi:diguanylate cyclase (GGDEF)-like protein/excisionase family DNA binding protein